MHEYSIVQALLEQCEEHAKANSASQILEVTVKIGVQSGVEVHLFETAFESFKEKSVCDQAKLVIQKQPLLIYCGDCDEEFTLDKIEYSCPKCQNLLINVLDGEEMYLMRLEMQ